MFPVLKYVLGLFILLLDLVEPVTGVPVWVFGVEQRGLSCIVSGPYAPYCSVKKPLVKTIGLTVSLCALMFCPALLVVDSLIASNALNLIILKFEVVKLSWALLSDRVSFGFVSDWETLNRGLTAWNGGHVSRVHPKIDSRRAPHPRHREVRSALTNLEAIRTEPIQVKCS